MGRERGITDELGYRNWIDSLAGEAIMLGERIREPELVVRAAGLARMAREIPYLHDRFSQVIAEAMYIEGIVAGLKNREQSIFIEHLFENEEERAYGSIEWDYMFLVVKGTYEIRLNLQIYRTKEDLKRGCKERIVKKLCAFFDDPSFESYTKQREEKIWEGQDFVTTRIYDHEGRLIRRIIDHEHEPVGDPSRGHQDIFFFEDAAIAQKAWAEIELEVTSSRK